jgi:penicillin-binding protein 2
MVGACSTGGTAFPFFPWNEGKTDFSAVACKTGTAQHGGKQAKPHAWIAVTGPITKKDGIYKLDLESPKRIVLVVMLEDAGEGSYEAGPVAKNILEKWFKAL